jgi:5-hydroxyisourate hydrolase-like protein (transthyretin family)
MTNLQEIMQVAKETGKEVMTVVTNFDGRIHTEWTATPQPNGAVELNYKIVDNPTPSTKESATLRTVNK